VSLCPTWWLFNRMYGYGYSSALTLHAAAAERVLGIYLAEMHSQWIVPVIDSELIMTRQANLLRLNSALT